MKFLVSGLLNTETTCPVRGFPINYYPIDYLFFGIETNVSGVAFNVSKALNTLGDEVKLCSLLGSDYPSEYILSALKKEGLCTDNIKKCLKKTPTSTVLYAPDGKRQVYCDLTDIQEERYEFTADLLKNVDAVIACNINFNRPLLSIAKSLGKPIATDVHVLSNIDDDFNRDFMNYADILFLSDEAAGDDYFNFIMSLKTKYPAKIIVMGRGSLGAALYLRDTDEIIGFPAYVVKDVVNTVGAGDALFSSFLHFYFKYNDPVSALKKAQAFAALKIKYNGGAKGFSSENEIDNFINSQK